MVLVYFGKSAIGKGQGSSNKPPLPPSLRGSLQPSDVCIILGRRPRKVRAVCRAACVRYSCQDVAEIPRFDEGIFQSRLLRRL